MHRTLLHTRVLRGKHLRLWRLTAVRETDWRLLRLRWRWGWLRLPCARLFDDGGEDSRIDEVHEKQRLEQGVGELWCLL